MPRTTRSAKANATVGPSTAARTTSTKASKKASTSAAPKPLLSKSTNVLKRKKSEVDKPKDGPSKPAKRVAFSTSAKAPAEETPQPSWNFTGEYGITLDEKSIDTFDTDGYWMKIFYYDAGSPRQLYATFKFDRLEGIMRLCPLDSYSPDARLADFEKACSLPPTKQPSRRYPGWCMRWRGENGGMGLDEKVGGELDVSCTFFFKHDPVSSSNEFEGMKIQYIMAYNNHVFKFVGTKTSNHPVGIKAVVPWSLERKWNELNDPTWGKAFDSEFDSDSGSDSDTDSDSTALVPRERIRVEPRRIGAPKLRSVRAASSSVAEGRPDWAWDITGDWKITSRMLTEALGLPNTASLHMDIFLVDNPRQYWAKFRFGDKLEGCMRFCLPSDEDRPGITRVVPIAQFQKECILEDGVWPGPSPRGHQKWEHRWRGRELDKRQNAALSDAYQSTINFDRGNDGQLTLTGIMVVHCQPVIIKGNKTGDLHARCEGYSWVLEPQWADLNPSVTTKYSAADAKYLMPITQPKPCSITGPSSTASGKFIEDLPKWAWDVTGHWDIEAPELIKAINSDYEDDETKTGTMRVHISNNPRHFKVGRQLWATFDFGNDVTGTLRFCPILPSVEEGPDSVKQFENACVLPSGCWPGASPKGQEKWYLRWRGINGGFRDQIEGVDKNQTQAKFEKGKDGHLHMKAVMIYNDQPYAVGATKVRNGEPPKGNCTVTSSWASGKPQSERRTGGGRPFYIVSAGWEP